MERKRGQTEKEERERENFLSDDQGNNADAGSLFSSSSSSSSLIALTRTRMNYCLTHRFASGWPEQKEKRWSSLLQLQLHLHLSLSTWKWTLSVRSVNSYWKRKREKRLSIITASSRYKATSPARDADERKNENDFHLRVSFSSHFLSFLYTLRITRPSHAVTLFNILPPLFYLPHVLILNQLLHTPHTETWVPF